MEMSELKNIISGQNIPIRSQNQWADSSTKSTRTVPQKKKIEAR